MRLKNCYATEIDLIKNQCQKLLALNAEKVLYKEDLEKFISNISYLQEILTNKETTFYFSKL